MAELKLENSIVDERYYVERCLGRGSYAEIFVAYDQRQNDLPVIIKALNTSLQGTPDVELERTLVENFQNEAIALDKVRHSHIIRRLGHGSAADLTGKVFHYLVLEYMSGGDLLSLCSRKPFRLNDALFYFEQVGEALAYAHSQQVIHRDIKPKNLLLSQNHQVLKIADFGVAKMTSQQDDDDEITRVGTNVYAPPEHHPDSDSEISNEKLTPSADVYSLAKTIYTAMTGRAPRQFSRRPITSLPTELASESWGDALLSVLRKATAMRVAERYASVQEFWDDFAKLNSLVADDADETTLVRKRLTATSDVEPTTSSPNFQVAAAAVTKRTPQQARIVVDLPVRSREPRVESRESEGGNQQSDIQALHNATLAGQGQAPVVTHTNHSLQNQFVQQNAVAENQPEALRRQRPPVNRAADSNVFDKMRTIFKSDWLRRAFIIFLVAALVGLVASVYFHFAGQRNIFSNADKDGIIGGSGFVNLRAEPNTKSTALRWLPKGTKVRALDEHEGWIKVRVMAVPPVDLPPDAPKDRLDADTGWISNGLIQF